MSKRGEELTDKMNTEEKMRELRANFVGRRAVIPVGGYEIFCYFTVAPTCMKGILKVCQENSSLITSLWIPCKEVKINTEVKRTLKRSASCHARQHGRRAQMAGSCSV